MKCSLKYKKKKKKENLYLFLDYEQANQKE